MLYEWQVLFKPITKFKPTKPIISDRMTIQFISLQVYIHVLIIRMSVDETWFNFMFLIFSIMWIRIHQGFFWMYDSIKFEL